MSQTKVLGGHQPIEILQNQSDYSGVSAGEVQSFTMYQQMPGYLLLKGTKGLDHFYFRDTSLKRRFFQSRDTTLVPMPPGGRE